MFTFLGYLVSGMTFPLPHKYHVYVLASSGKTLTLSNLTRSWLPSDGLGDIRRWTFPELRSISALTWKADSLLHATLELLPFVIKDDIQPHIFDLLAACRIGMSQDCRKVQSTSH